MKNELTQLLATGNNFPTWNIVISAHFGLKHSTKLEKSASLSDTEDAYLHSLIVIPVASQPLKIPNKTIYYPGISWYTYDKSW
jgi:hypothetical protein